ncbi:sulfotransferase family protein [Mangrovimicrobium sediminis]|uniref:Sulfotransferase family protein n=1 Tax=Mangrovimicrobium sediminis TaxID=2562682 RepID=A0A4Z0M0E4_9GAMM|nr:sulfotransferase [Haliea sp. SAOS-164]TGD72960.1 sulfotransferase family protein [Haliea sp. SAOS-164]
MAFSSQEYHKQVTKLMRNQQAKKALKLCNDWVARYPREALAHLMQGSLLRQRDPGKALPALATAVRLQPANPEPRLQLIECALAVRDYAGAAAQLDALTGQMSAQQIERAAGLCQRLARIPRQRDLLLVLARANALRPPLWFNLAEAEIALGNVREATAIYRKLLEANPRLQKAHFELARLERDPDTPHLAQMETLLASLGPDDNSVFLHYAIGKKYEDRGEHARAFEHYLQGGAQAKASGNYAVDADLRLVETIIAQDWQAPSVASAGHPVPIFVTGLPRSGTTLVERLLSNHPRVDTINETFFFQVAMQECAGLPPLAMPEPDTLPRALSAPPEKVGARYRQLVSHLLGDGDYFVEKLPENYLYLGAIAAALPGAKLVHVNRHPLDNALALFKQPFFRFAYDLDDLAAYYLAYHRLIQRWREMLGERLVEVSYEAFVGDPEGQARALFDALELPFDPAVLDLQSNASQSNSASAVQVREPVHQRSAGLWQQYREPLRPLLDALAQAGVVDAEGNLPD